MPDRAARRRYLAAMVRPGSDGLCKYCNHSVKEWHVGSWCQVCEHDLASCGAAEVLERRRRS